MLRLSWFPIRCNQPEQVTGVINRHLKGKPKDERPVDACVDLTGSWTNVVPDIPLAYAGRDWAQLLSYELATTAVCFFALEGLWEYSVFERGAEIAGMDARSEGRVFLYGDIDSACNLLGIEATVLKKYCRTYPIPERLQDLIALVFERDYGDRVRVFPDDEFDPWNEWAHCDLARKFGARYPEISSAPEITFDGRESVENWPDLPARLDTRQTRCYPTRWPLERLHPRNWP
jgi:hypothetical protein